MRSLGSRLRRLIAPIHPPLRDLLVYMRLLRVEGEDNRILRRLAQPQPVENFVGLLVETSALPQQLEVDTLVVSDIHLGSKHSLAKALRKALPRFRFKRLVLNGDIFDRLDMSPTQLAGHQTALLSDLHALAKTREVVWINGNHDKDLATLLQSAGVVAHTEYEWEYGGKRYLALHGDQFDRFSRERPVLYAIGTSLYTMIQNLGPWTRELCVFLKRKTKWYTNALDFVTAGAIEHARHRGVDYILCGHTHHVRYESQAGVHYYNSGGWTESPAHLIAVGESGIRVHAFSAEGEHLGALSPIPA